MTGMGSGALAIHVDDALTCGRDKFFTTILVPLLGQFSISKLEQSSFKFLGMHIKQAVDFLRAHQARYKVDKESPHGCGFFTRGRETDASKVSGGSIAVS